MNQILQSLSQELTTVILLTALILVFYLAYKILSMVTQTILIAVLSGIFYTVLTLFLELPLTLENTLFFAVTGAALYVGYTILITTVSVAKHIIEIPIKIIELILYPIRKLIGRAKKKYKKVEQQKKQNKKKNQESEKNEEQIESSKEKEDSKGTKEVVIDKLAEEEKEE